LTPKAKHLLVPAFMAGTLLILWLLAETAIPWHTRLQLKDGETGRLLLSTLLRDGEQATLKWHNSLFDLDVTEVFVANSGALIQTEVTFADPRGLPPMKIPPEEVDDYYHTGGPFTTSGLQRRFSRIVYRVGEIGNPHFMAGKKRITLKHEVGFGGQVILSTTQPRLFDLLPTAPAFGQGVIGR
jgi:hypothetical protein